jgi:Lipid A 3-O-deacylase (PagL)
MSLRGSLGVTPLAVFSRPADSGRAYTYGGGLSSGLELTTRNPWRFQPYGDAGIGCLIFTQPTPVADSRRFNFAFYLGPGFRIPRYQIRFGVWYHHFSNARTAQGNPGLDSLIAYVGYSFFRRK